MGSAGNLTPFHQTNDCQHQTFIPLGFLCGEEVLLSLAGTTSCSCAIHTFGSCHISCPLLQAGAAAAGERAGTFLGGPVEAACGRLCRQGAGALTCLMCQPLMHTPEDRWLSSY